MLFYNFQDTAGLFSASEINLSVYSTAEWERRYRQATVILTSSTPTAWNMSVL
jgi:hypothetical protein